MSQSLHDALTELADEITPDDVPTGLAGSAWGAADLERRRARRHRVAGGLATAAAAALTFWLVLSAAGGGLVDGSPAGTPSSVGLPQRVTFQEEPSDLPAKGEPLAAVVRVGSRGMPPSDPTSRATTNGGSPWQALTGDGRLWTIGEDVAPVPALADGQELAMPAAPAITPDGRVMAISRTVEQVIHEDSTSRTAESVVQRIDIHDVTTGQHDEIGDLCGRECTVAALRWSPDGRTLGILTYDATGPLLVTTPVLEDGTALTRTRLEGDAPQVAFAGWSDASTAVVVPLTESQSVGVDGWVTPVVVDARSGQARPLAPLNVPENAVTDGIEPDGITLISGALAVPDAGPDPRWWIAHLRPSPHLDGHLSVPEIDGLRADGGTARLLHGLPSSDGAVITRAATGGPAFVLSDRSGGEPRLRTVMAPGLDIQDIVLAAGAPDGPVTSHPFGTRTSWVSWHPGATAALVLTPFVLAGVWLLWRRVRRG